MASDQSYCLECGGCRTHLGSELLDRLRTGGSGASTSVASAPVAPVAPVVPSAPTSTRSSGPTAVIAGVGVLLLSMGIGVLIGRSGSPTGKAATAPAQVISVASPGAGGATATTPPLATTPTPSKSPAHKGAGISTAPSGAGSSPSKPAPPTVLNNLRTGGSGQSYEQKSKNLPNVVSTG